jgi:excisionase family DNA binding protein
MQNDIILSSIRKDDLVTLIKESIKEGLILAKPTVEVTDDFINEKEAAKFLQVSKATMHLWRKSGVIPFYRIGSRIRYKKSELLKASETKRKYKRALV